MNVTGEDDGIAEGAGKSRGGEGSKDVGRLT